jgi:DNA-binding XRE family transcriptional regulator
VAERKRTYEVLQAEWGERIRNARGDDRTQTWLAKQVGVDQTTISRIERGVYRLTPELMVALSAVLDQPLHKLFAFPRGLLDREQFDRENRRLRSELEAAS